MTFDFAMPAVEATQQVDDLPPISRRGSDRRGTTHSIAIAIAKVNLAQLTMVNFWQVAWAC